MKDNGLLVQYFTANTTDSQNLWKKAAEDAAVLKKMGATAVWFPPATKGAQGKEDMGYAPYDLYDLGEFDQKGSVGTRYGTKDEYLKRLWEHYLSLHFQGERQNIRSSSGTGNILLE